MNSRSVIALLFGLFYGKRQPLDGFFQCTRMILTYPEIVQVDCGIFIHRPPSRPLGGSTLWKTITRRLYL